MIHVPGAELDFPFEAAVAWPEAEPEATLADALVFVCQERRLLVRRAGERAEVPSWIELREHPELPDPPAAAELLYLGRLHGRPVLALALDPGPSSTRALFPDRESPLPEDHLLGHLRKLYRRLDPTLFWVAGRAMQILDWDQQHRYCGRCGEATERHPRERCRRCPACGLAVYPRLAPAVIVLVERGDRMLLARGPHLPPGMHSTLAGFVEPGESLEQTVQREIREEVGIEVGDLRYFGSQPWPFPHSLMVGFRARWVRGEIQVDGEEIESAGWYGADDLPEIPPRLSIARSLIDAFLDDLASAGRAESGPGPTDDAASNPEVPNQAGASREPG